MCVSTHKGVLYGQVSNTYPAGRYNAKEGHLSIAIKAFNNDWYLYQLPNVKSSHIF